MKRAVSLMLVVLMLIMTSCQLKPELPKPADTVKGDDTTSEVVVPFVPVDGISSDFKYALGDYIEKSMGDKITNYMVSPLSFQYAIGMLLAGAEGETKTQLLNSLEIKDDESFEYYIKSFNAFTEQFNARKNAYKERYDKLSEQEREYLAKPAGVMRVANSVWKRDDVKDFLDEYKSKLEMYNAEHFSFIPSDIVDRANKWANDKTEGMIQRILPDDYDASELAVLLMNALYYKNGWKYQFNEIGKLDFTDINNTKVQKDYIFSTQSYKYYKDDSTELVVVPMQDDVFITFVIGNTENLDEKISKAEYKKVCVKIPEFEIESSFINNEFVSFLKNRGVVDSFDKEKADFGKMINLQEADFNLYVEEIIQKTKIKLDKTGVEAAAVTAVAVYGLTSVMEPEPVIEFTADKPFRFFIHSAYLPTCGNTTEGELMTPDFLLFSGLLAK